MSQEEPSGIPIVQTERTESNYEQLEAQKRAIFIRIMENKDFSEEEKEFLINRIFEYSIEDGLEIADALSLDREARLKAITRYAFLKKHQAFASKLRNKLVEYSPFANEQDANEIDSLSEELARDISNTEKRQVESKTKKLVDCGDEAEALIEQIDDYYTHFLRLRGVKEKEAPDDRRSKGERTAEKALVQDMRVLEPHYYTGPIKDLVGKNHPLLHKPLIRQSELTELFTHLHLSLDDKETSKKIEQARYLPMYMTWNLLHKDGKKELKAEIAASLKDRGYKDGDFELAYDEQTGQYRILDKTPGHQELKKENLRLVKEVPTVFEMTKDDVDYTKVREWNSNFWQHAELDKETEILKLRRRVFLVEGQIYQKIICDDYKAFFFYPDGRRSKIYHASQDFKMTKKGLAFLINDFKRKRRGGNNFQLVINEKRLNDDDSFDHGMNYFEDKDGSIYSLDFDFDFNSQLGRYMISKNDKTLESFPWGVEVESLCLIDGKITYIKLDKKESFVIYGEEVFGPFSSEYSKAPKIVVDDKNLVFVAEKNDGTKVIYNDDQERETNTEGDIVSSVKVGGIVYCLLSKPSGRKDKRHGFESEIHLYWIVDENGNKIANESEEIRNLSSFNNKLVYTQDDGNDQYSLHYGDEIRDISVESKEEFITGERGVKIIGEINGDLFYRTKSSVYSFNSGLVDLGGNLELYEAKISDGKMTIIVKEDDVYKVFEYSPEFQITEEERRKLELLNALRSESLQVIEAYFKKYYSEEVEKGLIERLNDVYKHSKNFAQIISTMIKETPALFLRDLSAKKDDLTDSNVDQFISSLFPELKTNLERAKNKAKYERNRRDREDSIRSCLEAGRELSKFNDGDPKEENPPEVLKLREPITEFLSTGVYGQYNKNRKSWEQVGFSISQEHIGPTREVTAEIPVVKYMKDVILPKCLDGVIIPERVRGIKADGEEILLVVTVNTLGEARVNLPNGLELKKIVYSQTLQDLPTVPTEVSEKEYTDFVNDCNRRFGRAVSEKITALPEELRIFVDSLKDKTPVEKLEEIESFVRSIGYYDFDNREMQELKRGKSLEENLSIMGQRMKEMRRNKPEEAEGLAHKKYAGVCSDFAKLTTSLLREAGFVSGMVMGLQPDGVDTSITTKNAHAITYALWPDGQGKAKIIALDGTPAGMNEAEEKLLFGIRQRSLKERRKIFDEEKGKVIENADKLLKDLEDLIANLDEEGIKRLKNGKLEKALNIILGQVRESHLSVIDTVLNASRYAGFDVTKIITRGEIEDELSLRMFMESEISRERKSGGENKYFMGENLLKSIKDFVSRYEKDRGVGGKKEAFDIVEKVFDMAKNSLDPIESRSAIAVITYLRSEHISSV